MMSLKLFSKCNCFHSLFKKQNMNIEILMFAGRRTTLLLKPTYFVRLGNYLTALVEHIKKIKG